MAFKAAILNKEQQVKNGRGASWQSKADQNVDTMYVRPYLQMKLCSAMLNLQHVYSLQSFITLGHFSLGLEQKTEMAEGYTCINLPATYEWSWVLFWALPRLLPPSCWSQSLNR